MAILGKISGTMLKDNLLRNGVDLIIDGNLMYYDVVNRRVGIGTVTPGNVLTVNGAATLSNIFANNNVLTSLNGNLILNAVNGNISANNLRITDIGLPTSNTDAVSKAYVDASVIALSSPNLTISNSSTTTNVILNSETLVLAGTANQIISTITENSVTFSLPANVVANSSFIATNQMIGYHTGAIGANVPNSGAFTTLTVNGAANINTMTAATIAAATIGNSGATLTGTLSTAAQTNITSLGTLSSLTVSGATTTGSLATSSGGQITGYFTGAIGANTPNTGVFTTVTTSNGGELIGYHTGPIGANTANSGSFTTLTASGNVNLDSGVLFVDSVQNRVGIGTTTPGGRFDVKSSGDGTVFRVLRSGSDNGITVTQSGGGLRINLTDGGSNNFDINPADGTGGITLNVSNGSPVRVHTAAAKNTSYFEVGSLRAIFTGGNVGIGNTSPQHKLTVNGNVLISNTLEVINSIGASGIIYANAGIQGSLTGSLNGTVGTIAPNTGVFTSVATSGGGQITGYLTGVIGANTPNTGIFTSITTTGTITGNAFLSNAVYANTIGNTGATIVGVIGTNSQPFITSVGNLVSLTVNGNTFVGNVITSGANSQLIGYHTGAIGANVPNTGAFTNVTINGNANINAMSAATIAAATITAATIGNIGANLIGTLSTASQPNITSVGTLSSLTVTGNLTVGNIQSSGQLTGYFNGVIGANSANVGTFTNLTVTNNLISTGNTALTTGNIGNLYISQNNITAINANGNIIITPSGNGLVSINSTQALILPIGNNLNRPAVPTEGMIRFNTASNVLEMYDGAVWQVVSSTIATTIVSDSFIGDNVTTAFTMSQESTTGGTLVTINGIIQIPDVAYSVTGNSLQFVEAPVSTDVIEARILTTTSTVTALSVGNSQVSFDTAANSYAIIATVGDQTKLIIGNANTTVYNTLVTSGNVAIGSNLTVNQSGIFRGPFNENATLSGVYIGNTGTSPGITPRIGFFNGNTSQNWQIDNNSGEFRWFTPGVSQLTLYNNGNLSARGGYAVNGKKAVNGPAFRAYVATGQTISSGSQQKVTFGSENFDTDSCFASSSFTPTVEGYYQLNATVRLDGNTGTGECMIVLYKNGSEYARGWNSSGTQIAQNFWSMSISDIAYANGTTDYFEVYIQQTDGVNKTTTAGTNISFFSGCMIRGA